MDRSLINAQIQFLETKLALIHIPIHLFPHFTHPIFQLLQLIGVDGLDDEGLPRSPWAFVYPFANISINTFECSIACPSHLVKELFDPIMDQLLPAVRDQISIGKDDYLVLQVGGQDPEAGQRVVSLTGPLALADIPIFFITSYYSDFIMVPVKSQAAVIHAFQQQGFTLDHSPYGARGQHMTNAFASSSQSRKGFGKDTKTDKKPSSPTSPPAASILDLQTRTFITLGQHNIEPTCDTSLQLVSTAGHRADKKLHARLMHAVSSCLLSIPPPKFVCLTLTDSDSLSLTMDKVLLTKFSRDGQDDLLISDEIMVPIMLDLRKLPEECTGIVCGVAAQILEGINEKDMHRSASGPGKDWPPGREMYSGPGFNMSYLSTARAGSVIVREDEVEDAIEVLKEVVERISEQTSAIADVGGIDIPRLSI